MPIYRCIEMSKVVKLIRATTPRQAAQILVDQEYWPDGWYDAEIWVERGNQRWKFVVKIPRDH